MESSTYDVESIRKGQIIRMIGLGGAVDIEVGKVEPVGNGTMMLTPKWIDAGS